MSVMNGYASTYAPRLSPTLPQGYAQVNSPATAMDVYSANGLGYIQAASPQPITFAAVGVSPLSVGQSDGHQSDGESVGWSVG